MSPAAKAVKNYFAEIIHALVTVMLGMVVTIKCFFSRPFTLQYPEEAPEIPDGFRGLHIYEVEKCIACGFCVDACPIKCINLEAEGKGKTAKILRYDIDYTLCLFCNLCCEVCPTKCINMGKEFDLASYSRETCRRAFVETPYVKSAEKEQTEQ